jgi:hypothetical protein
MVFPALVGSCPSAERVRFDAASSLVEAWHSKRPEVGILRVILRCKTDCPRSIRGTFRDAAGVLYFWQEGVAGVYMLRSRVGKLSHFGARKETDE